jgi:hypothetical protein
MVCVGHRAQTAASPEDGEDRQQTEECERNAEQPIHTRHSISDL